MQEPSFIQWTIINKPRPRETRQGVREIKPRIIFFTSSIYLSAPYLSRTSMELTSTSCPYLLSRRLSQVRAYSKNREFALDENSENKVTQTRKCPATITLTVHCTFSPIYLVSARPSSLGLYSGTQISYGQSFCVRD